MTEPQLAAFGSWKSPITSDLIVGASIALDGIALDGDAVYWLEGRPTESGRYVVVRRDAGGAISDASPPTSNVRTRVHEYGGAAWSLHQSVLYYVNYADQHLYRYQPDGTLQRVSIVDGMRYADMVVDERRARVIAVREDHTDPNREAVNTIAALSLSGRDEQVLVQGNAFYSNPRLSPDGTQLCWLTWNHPNMPWDGTELWVAPVHEDGSLGASALIAGGVAESIFQPLWSPGGVLHFVSDRTDWWNLYRFQDGNVEALHPMSAEFGLPQWVFGQSTYGFTGPQEVLCSFEQNGVWRLALLDERAGTWTPIDCPYKEFDGLATAQGRALFIGASPSRESEVVLLTLDDHSFQVLKRSSEERIDPGFLSEPQTIEFPTEHGLSAHGFYYPPSNHLYRAPDGERPPLLVKSHGGPTGETSPSLNLKIQYWTSRGFGVLDVNYGGSTGYGRAYRQRLNGNWGVVDVDDCVNGAQYLVQLGLADGKRLCIDGGSAGGYTTLCALAFRSVFAAGASYYGISDAEALAQDTHKFESRYGDSMFGPLPQAREVYIQRSPIHFTDRLSCPLILFQGMEDKVVLPNQAEKMYEAVRAKGLPVAYIAFEGEQHGFRIAANIKRALEAEFYFYSRVFGFTPADDIEPVHIENL